MPAWTFVSQAVIGLLATPVVVAALGWLIQRATEESRLLLRVERLASLYANLAPGPERDEFATRMNESVTSLNRLLDPQAKRGRERRWVIKWSVAFALFAAALAVAALLGALHSFWTGIMTGAIAGVLIQVAWWLIDRKADTAATPSG